MSVQSVVLSLLCALKMLGLISIQFLYYLYLSLCESGNVRKLKKISEHDLSIFSGDLPMTFHLSSQSKHDGTPAEGSKDLGSMFSKEGILD